MPDFNKLTVEDLIKIAKDNEMRIEIQTEPASYGGVHTTIMIEPWKAFEPTCPYGTPIVYVKEDKKKGNP